MPTFHKGTSGKIFGVSFSKAEQKAMDEEITRQWKDLTIEYDRKHGDEIISLILWVLYEHFGFREKRLKRIYTLFDKYVADMTKRYQLSGADDDVWLCTRKLKEAGYDINEWANDIKDVNDESQDTTCCS